MPVKRRRGIRKRQDVDPKRYLEIVYVVGVEGAVDWNPFAVFRDGSASPISGQERSIVWRLIRREHIAYCIERYPGERPPGFWEFDYDGRDQRKGESDIDFAVDVLDMDDDERERARGATHAGS